MKNFENSGYVYLSAPEKQAIYDLFEAVVNTARPSTEENKSVDCLHNGVVRLDVVAWSAVNSLILKLQNNG